MEKYTDKTILQFGAHKGKALANVPAGYLLYLHGEGCKNVMLRNYIEDNLEALKKEESTKQQAQNKWQWRNNKRM